MDTSMSSSSDKENQPSTHTTPIKQQHVIQNHNTLENCWLIPYIAHFIWLFQKQLHMSSITPAQLEHAIQYSSTDTTMHILLTRILLSRQDRAKLNKNEYWPYDQLVQLIQITFDFWFTDFNTDSNKESDSDKSNKSESDSDSDSGTDEYELDPNEVESEADYASIVRTQYTQNPLQDRTFDELTSIDKARVIHTILEYYLNDTDGEFIQHLRSLEPSHCRIEPIGVDDNKSFYYFFGFNDWRIYKSTAQQPIQLQRSYSNNSQHSHNHTVDEPIFELITHNATELQKLIRQYKKQTGKSQQLKDLITALEQALELCNNNAGHNTTTNEERTTKKQKIAVVQPLRGSARLEQSMLEQQQKLQQQAELEAKKRTRRHTELEERADEYTKEVVVYYQLLTKAIRRLNS